MPLVGAHDFQRDLKAFLAGVARHQQSHRSTHCKVARALSCRLRIEPIGKPKAIAG